MASSQVLTGGCQCGRVRYRFEGQLGRAEACHCRMCQKAGGNWGLALVALAVDGLVWTDGRAAEFRSSSFVARGFCDRCGTPLYMREDDDPVIEITVGSLDDPDVAPPYRAVGVESKLRWVDTLASLPAHPTEGTRSSATVARLRSLQHPGRDARRDKSDVETIAARPCWRLANAEDFDSIIEMNKRLNAEDPSESMPFDRTMMERTLGEILMNPLRGAVAVLESAGRHCGYGLLISFWSNEFGGEVCAVDELYVEPEFRGRGFATQLIQILINGGSPIWPRRTAMITVEAYRTNPRAKALYERLGFGTSPNHSLTLVLGGRAVGG